MEQNPKGIEPTWGGYFLNEISNGHFISGGVFYFSAFNQLINGGVQFYMDRTFDLHRYNGGRVFDVKYVFFYIWVFVYNL